MEIKNYSRKLSKNLIRKTPTENGVKLEIRSRDDDDEIIWKEMFTVEESALTAQIAATETQIENLRETKRNLEAMKNDLFPQLKK